MSQFTTLCHVVRAGMLVAAGEAVSYLSWDAPFVRENLNDKVKDLQHHIICENMGLTENDPHRSYRFDRRNTFINDNVNHLLKQPDTINEDQLKRLDFRRWDEPRAGLELWLIPLYLVPFLAPGQEVYNILGTRKELGPETDLDHRQGMLSFGWMLEAGRPFPEEKTNLEWAVSKWNDEVKNRPLTNTYRRTLDTTWRQVITHHGGDPDALVGPSHDALIDP